MGSNDARIDTLFLGIILDGLYRLSFPKNGESDLHVFKFLCSAFTQPNFRNRPDDQTISEVLDNLKMDYGREMIRTRNLLLPDHIQQRRQEKLQEYRDASASRPPSKEQEDVLERFLNM